MCSVVTIVHKLHFEPVLELHVNLLISLYISVYTYYIHRSLIKLCPCVNLKKYNQRKSSFFMQHYKRKRLRVIYDTLRNAYNTSLKIFNREFSSNNLIYADT